MVRLRASFKWPVAVCALVRQGLGVAIVNPLTAMELAGPDLVLRGLSVPIAFQVNLLLPAVAASHPLRDALTDALVATAQSMEVTLVKTLAGSR